MEAKREYALVDRSRLAVRAGSPCLFVELIVASIITRSLAVHFKIPPQTKRYSSIYGCLSASVFQYLTNKQRETILKDCDRPLSSYPANRIYSVQLQRHILALLNACLPRDIRTTPSRTQMSFNRMLGTETER